MKHIPHFDKSLFGLKRGLSWGGAGSLHARKKPPLFYLLKIHQTTNCPRSDCTTPDRAKNCQLWLGTVAQCQTKFFSCRNYFKMQLCTLSPYYGNKMLVNFCPLEFIDQVQSVCINWHHITCHIIVIVHFFKQWWCTCAISFSVNSDFNLENACTLYEQTGFSKIPGF